jgi:hypothetical protein
MRAPASSLFPSLALALALGGLPALAGAAPASPASAPRPAGPETLQERQATVEGIIKAGPQHLSVQQARALGRPKYLFAPGGTFAPPPPPRPDAFASAPPLWQALNQWRRPR